MNKYIILSIAIIFLLILEYIIIKRRNIKKFNLWQKNLIDRYYNDVDLIYKKMRGWRHDYHNHIQVMKAYLELGKYKEIEEYLNNLNDDLQEIDTSIKTGNLMADAILNTKVSLATAKNIKLNIKVAIPKNIPLSDLDLCVVLGNLLDNAIEACMTLDDEEERFIRIYMRQLNENFYISITNSYKGTRKKLSGKYFTTKSGKNHGFGSTRVDGIVKKHNAYINRQSEEGAFAVEVMFPLKK